MDKLILNRNYEAYCGKEIAFEYVAAYILEHSDTDDIKDIKVAVVSDRIVSGYYYNKFENQFIVRGLKPTLISVECQEASKGLNAADSVFKYLNDCDFGPNDWIIALGGGGVLDVTSFVASVINGGIHYIAVPTTMCAMAEVAISDNSRLNSGRHKDLIMSGNDPEVILVDPSFLKAVPDKIKHNGYASIIRYAILEDLNILLKLTDPGDLREYLNAVYSVRNRIENKNPQLLTLGNEISSAIEAYFRFMNYSEGEALALSLLASVDEKRRTPMMKIYGVLGLPTKLEGVSGKMILKTLTDRMKRYKTGMIDIVDMDTDNGDTWVIRKVDYEDALNLLAKRIAIISDLEIV